MSSAKWAARGDSEPQEFLFPPLRFVAQQEHKTVFSQLRFPDDTVAFFPRALCTFADRKLEQAL